MKKILGLSVMLCIALNITIAQSWTQVEEQNLSLSGIQDFKPTKSIIAQVSDADIKEILWSAPYEYESRAGDSPARLKLMMADGSTKSFGIVRYDMQEPLLAAKFDNIRTFKGVCLSDTKIRVRLDYTVHGLRAWINSPGNHSYIEHYKRGNKDYKIVYDRKDFPKPYEFTCSVTEQKIEDSRDYGVAETRQGNCEFNTLRLANATTGEYSDFHISDPGIPDEEEVHSAVVTAINRVNEVYEQDFGVRNVLIDNNELVYFYDGATDPYSNTNGGAMLSQNQTTIDDEIGNANYDIGHVFSTGGGGVAYLSSVCNNGNKAGGVTGQGSPIGDPFSIDYVAHEMGHQMGANHTQNNSCNRNNSTAMEPGSASTIMGYAGICSPNVQNNSDPYFHAISVDEVMNDASVFSCAVEETNFGNTSPEVTIDEATYAIPKSTYFVLDANGTDADGDDLTYCWEQMDNQVATMPPNSTNTSGPAFRSLEPVEDSKRYFPSLPDILAGNNPTWEVIPSVTRDMDFRVTVRDWHDGPGTTDGGCTAEADVVVEVDGASGPFIVTSHTTNSTWMTSDTETITWDVANTDNATVNCTNVEIWFSLDDSFDTPTLVLTTANDGSADITVPSTVTTTGKYMVKGENNIFFDINEGVITIEESDPTFNLTTTPTSASICNVQDAVTVKINTTSVLDYDTPINLTASGLPAGASVSFTDNPVTPGEFTFMELTGLAGNTGVFDVSVNGQSGIINKSTTYELSIAGPAAAPALTSPTDGATGVDVLPTLIWEDVIADNFEYELSLLPNGGDLVASGMVTNNQVVISTELLPSNTYYWRVKTNNICGSSSWSADNTFSTVSCITYTSDDIPVDIASEDVVTITSTLLIQDRGEVTDLDIVDLVGEHSWMNDLNFSLSSPDNTKMEFWDQPCGNNDDFDINFDDEATADHPCPATDGGTYVPDNSLTTFDTKSILGEWELEIFDDFAEDGGQLQSWGIKVCLTDFCDLTVSNTSSIGLGSLNGALACAIANDTIRLMPDITGQTINVSGAITIAENIHILADPADNITINFVGNNGFIVGSGVSTSFEGFSIQSSGIIPTIQNNGTLKLTDVNVVHPINNQVLNNGSASLEINGECNINK